MQEDIHDITEASGFPLSPVDPALILLGIAGVILLVALILLVVRMCLKEKTPPPPCVIQQALEKIDELEGQSAGLTYSDQISALSLILREAQTQLTDASSYYQSQQEYQRAVPHSITLSPGHSALSIYLDRLWQSSYRLSNQEESAFPQELSQARQLLKNLQTTS